MAQNFKNVWVGLRFKPVTTLTSDSLGEVQSFLTDNKTYLHNGTTRSPLVTADHAETLTSKTIDADNNTISELEVDNLKAGVLNTSTTLAAASDTQVPSALAVKTYIDDGLATQNEASEITYDNSTSGLTATNVQDALDEIDLDLDNAQTVISDHIADTVDAHDASAISVIAQNGISSTDVQNALEELQSEITTVANGSVSGPVSSVDNAITRFDGTTGKIIQNSSVTISDAGIVAGSSIDADTNTITNIKNADIKAGAAIDAAKIADGSVSNAEFQTLDGVTSSIQTQLNAKASSSALTTHVNDVANPHAVTKTQVGLSNVDNTSDATKNSATATLTNKTIVGASIQTPIRSDVKQDTKANLTSYASTATNGQIVFATDTKEYFAIKDGLLSDLGGDGTGSGSLDTILQLTATEQLTDWSTGNNATVLGGGVLAGSFVKNTLTPLHGNESYQYTQAAGSLNDYFLSKSFPVDARFRGQQVYFSAPIQYNGNTGDIQIVIYDVTNATVLTTLSDSGIATNGATQTVIASALLPLTCANVRVGFQVKVLNSGKVLAFDDIQVSQSLYQAAQLNNVTDWQAYTPTFTGFGTPTAIELQYRRNGSDLELRGKFATGTTSATEARIYLPAGLVSADTSKIPTLQYAGEVVRNVGQSGTIKVLIEPSVSYVTMSLWDNSNSALTKANGSTLFGASQFVSFKASIPIQGWTAGNTAIVTPTQQISSDTMSFNFKATAINPATDAIGTFNTYTYAANTNTATISGSAPTQTTASMNVNGIQVFARAYNAASTTGSPARVEIFIGRGLKSYNLDMFGAINKTIPTPIIYAIQSATRERGILHSYDATTGLLVIDGGYNTQSSNTARDLDNILDLTNSYFVFNASTTPSITALPVLQPRIAYLSDVKPGGTGGGTSSTGNQTRTLNTIVDPTGIVTSLTANQFTLQAGSYCIEATAQAYKATGHRIRIRNITDSTTSIIGSGSYTSAADVVDTHSILKGGLIITSAKTFELQHYIGAGVATVGLGNATSTGESEVYAQVKIVRIK